MEKKPQGRKKNISGEGREIQTSGPAQDQGPVGSQDGYSGRDMNGPSGPQRPENEDSSRASGGISRPLGGSETNRPSTGPTVTEGIKRPAAGGGTSRPASGQTAAGGISRPAAGSGTSRPASGQTAAGGTGRPAAGSGMSRPASGQTGTGGTGRISRPLSGGSSVPPANRPASGGSANVPPANRPGSSGGNRASGGGGRLWIIILVIAVLFLAGGGFSGLFGGGNNGGQTNLPVTPAKTAAVTAAPTAAPTAVPAAPTAVPAAEQDSGESGSLLDLLFGSWDTDAGITDVNALSPQFAESAYRPTAAPVIVEKPAAATASAAQTSGPAASAVRSPYTVIRGGGKDTVTLMVYMCGTDLESKSAMATRDLQEMLAASFGDSVRLIIQTGGCTNWRNNVISSKCNQRWQVKNGKLVCLNENCGTGAMVSPSTLSDFIAYCAKTFPADRYGLILWDHGSGSVSGYGYDEKNPRAGSMTLSGISQALKDGGVKFDFIGFDACLMATVENALMLDSYADYLIASEETEPGYGWYYTDWLNALGKNTSMSTVDLGRKIADDFVRTSAQQAAGQKTTLSVVDLAQLSAAVPEKLNAWARSISGMIEKKQYQTVSAARNGAREFAESSRLDQVDLIDLARRMGTDEGEALADAVAGAVRYNITSSNMRNAYGLSIYFPYQKLSNVDKAVSAYSQLGMDDSYIACIRQFASLEMSGQAVSGGTANPWGALSGGSSAQSAYGSDDLLSSILGSLLGGDFGRLQGMDGNNTAFMADRALDGVELTAYLSENMIDPALLVIRDTEDGKRLSMPAEQWALVQNIELNCFYDDGSGYLDLGLDGLYTLTDDGFYADTDGTWLAIDGQPVPYYQLSGDEDSRTGYVPALLNGDRVQLLISFDPEGRGYIVGARLDYVNGETDTVAKSVSGLPIGAQLQFVCDRYSYDGEYQATWLMYEPMTVAPGTLEVTDVYIDRSRVRLTYRLTDIYNQAYWTGSYTLE